MPSKVPMKLILKKKNQNMFQTCVPNQKSYMKGTLCHF